MPIVITNKLGLPRAFVDAAGERDLLKTEFEKESDVEIDFSASELAAPPQQTFLRKIINNASLACYRFPKHDIKVPKEGIIVEEDVSERIWSVFGKSVHYILEKFNTTDLVEYRAYGEIIGSLISAQIDHYEIETGTLTDYKVTSSWTHVFGAPDDWRIQLLIGAYLLNLNGYPVRRIRNLAIYRDWSERQMQQSPEYPKHNVGWFDWEMPTEEKLEALVEYRVKLHQQFQYQDPLYYCNDDEMWTKDFQLALMKEGRKSAVKVFSYKPNEYDVGLHKMMNWMQDNNIDINPEGDPADPKLRFEIRRGARQRCEKYCVASSICPQWKSHQEAVKANEQE